MSWYLRSVADLDTHRGRLLADGTVTAQCGAVFVPRPLAGYRGALLFPGEPPDPDQMCPKCKGSAR